MENVTEKTVLLDTFDSDFQADIVRGLLENNGIPSVTSGKSMSVILPLFASTDGGVRLFVKDSDLERAREIVREHKENNKLNSEEVSNNYTSPKTIIGACLFLIALVLACYDIYQNSDGVNNPFGTIFAISFVIAIIGIVTLVNGLNEKK